jgi:hypothetical protein
MEDDLLVSMIGCNNEHGGREVTTLDLEIAHEIGNAENETYASSHTPVPVSHNVTSAITIFLVANIELVISFF